MEEILKIGRTFVSDPHMPPLSQNNDERWADVMKEAKRKQELAYKWNLEEDEKENKHGLLKRVVNWFRC